jgi:hypothetical protein
MHSSHAYFVLLLAYVCEDIFHSCRVSMYGASIAGKCSCFDNDMRERFLKQNRTNAHKDHLTSVYCLAFGVRYMHMCCKCMLFAYTRDAAVCIELKEQTVSV